MQTLKYALLSMLLFLSLSADETSKKVVFEFTSGDINTFEKKILSAVAFHKNYYESKLEELEVAVVIHGDAYKFFIKDLSASRYKNETALIEKHKSFSKRLKALSELYKVDFYICESGVERLKINKDNIYPFIKLAATSTVALIDTQSDGYTFVPVF